MRNYECLREPPKYNRDIYADLRRIEERGKRKKQKREETGFFFTSQFRKKSNPIKY